MQMLMRLWSAVRATAQASFETAGGRQQCELSENLDHNVGKLNAAAKAQRDAAGVCSAREFKLAAEKAACRHSLPAHSSTAEVAAEDVANGAGLLSRAIPTAW